MLSDLCGVAACSGSVETTVPFSSLPEESPDQLLQPCMLTTFSLHVYYDPYYLQLYADNQFDMYAFITMSAS